MTNIINYDINNKYESKTQDIMSLWFKGVSPEDIGKKHNIKKNTVYQQAKHIRKDFLNSFFDLFDIMKSLKDSFIYDEGPQELKEDSNTKEKRFTQLLEELKEKLKKDCKDIFFNDIEQNNEKELKEHYNDLIKIYTHEYKLHLYIFEIMFQGCKYAPVLDFEWVFEPSFTFEEYLNNMKNN